MHIALIAYNQVTTLSGNDTPTFNTPKIKNNTNAATQHPLWPTYPDNPQSAVLPSGSPKNSIDIAGKYREAARLAREAANKTKCIQNRQYYSALATYLDCLAEQLRIGNANIVCSEPTITPNPCEEDGDTDLFNPKSDQRNKVNQENDIIENRINQQVQSLSNSPTNETGKMLIKNQLDVANKMQDPVQRQKMLQTTENYARNMATVDAYQQLAQTTVSTISGIISSIRESSERNYERRMQEQEEYDARKKKVVESFNELRKQAMSGSIQQGEFEKQRERRIIELVETISDNRSRTAGKTIKGIGALLIGAIGFGVATYGITDGINNDAQWSWGIVGGSFAGTFFGTSGIQSLKNANSVRRATRSYAEELNAVDQLRVPLSPTFSLTKTYPIRGFITNIGCNAPRSQYVKPSYRFSANIGASYQSIPTFYFSKIESYTDALQTPNVEGGVEFYPIFTNVAGISGFANGLFGHDGSNQNMEIEWGGRAFAGHPVVQVIGEYRYGYRNFQQPKSWREFKFDYNYLRQGIGLRFNWNMKWGRLSKGHLDFMYLQEKFPSSNVFTQAQTGYSARLWFDNRLSIYGVFFPSYYRTGFFDADGFERYYRSLDIRGFPINETYASTSVNVEGTLFKVGISRNFDLFGGKHK